MSLDYHDYILVKFNKYIFIYIKHINVLYYIFTYILKHNDIETYYYMPKIAIHIIIFYQVHVHYKYLLILINYKLYQYKHDRLRIFWGESKCIQIQRTLTIRKNV